MSIRQTLVRNGSTESRIALKTWGKVHNKDLRNRLASSIAARTTEIFGGPGLTSDKPATAPAANWYMNGKGCSFDIAARISVFYRQYFLFTQTGSWANWERRVVCKRSRGFREFGEKRGWKGLYLVRIAKIANGCMYVGIQKTSRGSIDLKFLHISFILYY